MPCASKTPKVDKQLIGRRADIAFGVNDRKLRVERLLLRVQHVQLVPRADGLFQGHAFKCQIRCR